MGREQTMEWRGEQTARMRTVMESPGPPRNLKDLGLRKVIAVSSPKSMPTQPWRGRQRSPTPSLATWPPRESTQLASLSFLSLQTGKTTSTWRATRCTRGWRPRLWNFPRHSTPCLLVRPCNLILGSETPDPSFMTDVQTYLFPIFSSLPFPTRCRRDR